MGKPGTAYNLYHEAERFMEKVKEEGFCVEKLFYEGQDVGNYEITKKINSAQNPLNNFEIIGHIFEGQLVIHSFPFSIERENTARKQAVKQLEKLAKDFRIR